MKITHLINHDLKRKIKIRCARSIAGEGNKSWQLRLKNFFSRRRSREDWVTSRVFHRYSPDEKKLRVGNKYKLQDYQDFSHWYGAPCSSCDNVLYFPDTSYKLRRAASWNQMYREIFCRCETTTDAGWRYRAFFAISYLCRRTMNEFKNCVIYGNDDSIDMQKISMLKRKIWKR